VFFLLILFAVICRKWVFVEYIFADLSVGGRRASVISYNYIRKILFFQDVCWKKYISVI